MKKMNAKQMRKIEKYNKWKICYWGLMIVYFVMLFLMYEKMLTGEIKSDYLAHFRSSTSGADIYSFNSLIMRILFSISEDTTLISIFFALIAIATPVALYYLFQMMSELWNIDIEESVLRYVAIGVCLISCVYIPVFYPVFYAGFMAYNPWHNGTYLTMRLFAIVAVIYFIKIYQNYLQKKIPLKNYCLLAMFLFLSTICKPSFFTGFAPMMVLLLTKDFIINSKQFKRIVCFSTTLLPAGIMVLLQYTVLFPGGDGGGICFGLSPCFLTVRNPVWKTILLLLVPVSVYAYNKYKNEPMIKSRIYNSMLLIWLILMFWFLFLYEAGPRQMHGNFSWGEMFGNYLIYATSICIYISNIKKIISTKMKKSYIDIIYMNGIGFLFVYQVATGIIYLCNILINGNYWA